MENTEHNTKKCLRCKHLNNANGNYCIYCGTPIRNICTNRSCDIYLSNTTLTDKAVFCPLCGSETLFKVYGMVNSPLDIPEEELPF